MPDALFRIALPDGALRLARGDSTAGPRELLDPSLTVRELLTAGRDGVAEAVRSSAATGEVPPGTTVLAPVDEQEVWAAGVTYRRSRDARMEESEASASVYDLVYDAARPELFFKAPAWRVRAHRESIGVRADSAWNVPEPELALVLAADLGIAGYTIGNDVSSRSIEGENPLYLPQAKVYDGSCALGPGIVPAASVSPPFAIALTVRRSGELIVEEETSTDRLHRSVEDLVEHLGRALAFPHGAVLLTGTGIVPDPGFTLRPGDTVTIRIGALGSLENDVVELGTPAGTTPQPPSSSR